MLNELLGKLGRAKEARLKMDTMLREVNTYFNNGQYDREYVNGEVMYTDIGTSALTGYTNKVVNDMIPMQTEWLKLTAGEAVPDDKKEEYNASLRDITTRMFKELEQSNFYTEAASAIRDMGLSTGILLVTHNTNKNGSMFNFKAMDLMSCWLYDETVFTLADETLAYREEHNIHEDEDIYETYYKNKYYKFTDSKIIETISVEYNPYVVFKSDNIARSPYGSGVCMKCVKDMKMLNAQTGEYFKALQLYSNPLLEVSDSNTAEQLRNGDNSAGTIINVVNPGTVKPVHTIPNPNMSYESLRVLEQRVNDTMLVQPYGNIQNTANTTAFEISVRDAAIQKQTAVHNARVQASFATPVFRLMLEIFKLYNPAIKELNIDHSMVTVELNNALAESSRAMRLSKINQSMQSVGNLPPEIITQKVNISKFPGEVFKIFGLEDLLNTPEEEAEVVAKLTQAAQGGNNGQLDNRNPR